MIFVTVGTQLAFPRLIEGLNDIAGKLDEEFIAQTGPYDGPCDNLTVADNLTPDAFQERFIAARVVVAHAGIGTILSAKRYKKPLILFPRRFEFGEHRNDHQLATARQVEKLHGVYVAWALSDIEEMLQQSNLQSADEEASPAREQLIGHLKSIIAEA